jgi:hypothetical protein
VKELPRIATVEQKFPSPKLSSLKETILEEFRANEDSLSELDGKRIAVTAGSRGIANLSEIVRIAVEILRNKGAHPFIVPAMGSHGGGTAEGQERILRGYGITEERVGAPILSSLETVQVGTTPEGVPVAIGRQAFEADAIVLLNRVKPHTDFKGMIESGLAKMIAVGLGKVEGADSFHNWTQKLNYEKLITSKARLLLGTGKVLLGIAVLENAYHETAKIEVIPASSIIRREEELLEVAKGLMPSLPVDSLDILIVDQIGKNISGSGMDPNIIGRWFLGSSLWQEQPDVQRIVVLALSDGSGGNATGIGLADFCTEKVVQQMNRAVTYLNVITSRNVVAGRLPMYFKTDRETICQAVGSLGGNVGAKSVRLLRIRDTLSLARIEASESLLPQLREHPHVANISPPKKMSFDPTGKLVPLHKEENGSA